MASTWAGVDNNFPTFTETDSTDEKFRKLVNYEFMLQEQLKYLLRNAESGTVTTGEETTQ